MIESKLHCLYTQVTTTAKKVFSQQQVQIELHKMTGYDWAILQEKTSTSDYERFERRSQT